MWYFLCYSRGITRKLRDASEWWILFCAILSHCTSRILLYWIQALIYCFYLSYYPTALLRSVSILFSRSILFFDQPFPILYSSIRLLTPTSSLPLLLTLLIFYLTSLSSTSPLHLSLCTAIYTVMLQLKMNYSYSFCFPLMKSISGLT